ncbi:hypothetical protein [Streptomyces sp. NPDC006631]|uniref:hypothetical protein n=1 Tax=Streptomyces sp. NPDC006631 TaxID=3364752 RepID=UPI0036BFFA08
MNMTRHGGADDTGEQDVRELRRAYEQIRQAKPAADFLDVGPFVRHNEDVPHEGAIPDLYGQPDDDEGSEEQVEEELLQMVEDGELCFGWLEDRGEFGFWFPEEEPATVADPAPEWAPEAVPEVTSPDPAPVRGSHRRPKERPLARKIFVGVAATLTAPFVIGVAAYAADHGNSGTNDTALGRPDLAADAHEEPPPADKPNLLNYQTQHIVRNAPPAPPMPTVTVTETVTATPSASPSGRVEEADAAKTPQTDKGTDKKKPGRHRKPKATESPAAQPPSNGRHRHHHNQHHGDSDPNRRQGTVSTSVNNAVNGILGSVNGLLS